MAKKLTEKHLLYKKAKMLEKFMSENDIVLFWDGYSLKISDESTTAFIRDLEDEYNEPITEFPYISEIKLIVED